MQLFLLLLLLSVPTIVFGGDATYQPLVGIPGIDNPAENFGNYLNQVYFLSISVAALIAVVKIIIAGVKWMTTDLVGSKSDAAGDIRSSLLGLLLIVSAVLILETINPQLTNFNVLRYATPARQAPPPQAPPIQAPPPDQGVVTVPPAATPAEEQQAREACEAGGGSFQRRVDRTVCVTPPQGLQDELQRTLPAGVVAGQNEVNNLTPYYVNDQAARAAAAQSLGIPENEIRLLVRQPPAAESQNVAAVRNSMERTCAQYGRGYGLTTFSNGGNTFYTCTTN